MMKIIDNCRSVAGALGFTVALCFSVAPAAQATILSNFLSFDGPVHFSSPIQQGGGEDKLQDDSLSTFRDGTNTGNRAGVLDAGDTLFGVITLSEINSSNRPSATIGPSSQIAIIYAAKVLTGDTTVAGTIATFGPADAGFLAGICGAVCAPAGILASTIGVALSTSQGVDALVNPQNDPLNWDAAGANGFTANFNGANGNGPWSWELTLGMTDGSDNFFQAFSFGDSANEKAAFDITSQAFAATWQLVDVKEIVAATVHTNEVTLDQGTIQFADTEEVSRGWAFRDQGSFFVNAVVPEPSILALMGIALAGMAGVARRRRKQ